jgi:hypothetical protein
VDGVEAGSIDVDRCNPPTSVRAPTSVCASPTPVCESRLNPRAAIFVPRAAGRPSSAPSVSLDGIVAEVVLQVTTSVRAEIGAWMGTLVCRMATPRLSGGRQRRAARVRRRGVRQLGCGHFAFVGEDEGQRRFYEAASASGVTVGFDVYSDSASEGDYYSAEELDEGVGMHDA